MRILIAEDSHVSRRLLEAQLQRWGHEVEVAADGDAAWEAIQQKDAPALAILDWMMPGVDGVEICRRARARGAALPLYIILLTARTASEDVVQGLDAGADDYVTKPFRAAELQARLGVGIRIVLLQRQLAERVAELEEALAHVKSSTASSRSVRTAGESGAMPIPGTDRGVRQRAFRRALQPRNLSAVPGDGGRTRDESSAATTRRAGGPEGDEAMKVLLADDDRVLVHLFRARLQALGWQVETGHDAMQTLMFAIRSEPDVIVLDIGMPGGTGFGVLTKLKQSVRTEGIPVVVMSGSIAPEDEAKVLDLGAVAFFRKPVDPETLHQALSRLVTTGSIAELA